MGEGPHPPIDTDIGTHTGIMTLLIRLVGKEEGRGEREKGERDRRERRRGERMRMLLDWDPPPRRYSTW